MTNKRPPTNSFITPSTGSPRPNQPSNNSNSRPPGGAQGPYGNAMNPPSQQNTNRSPYNPPVAPQPNTGMSPQRPTPFVYGGPPPQPRTPITPSLPGINQPNNTSLANQPYTRPNQPTQNNKQQFYKYAQQVQQQQSPQEQQEQINIQQQQLDQQQRQLLQQQTQIQQQNQMHQQRSPDISNSYNQQQPIVTQPYINHVKSSSVETFPMAFTLQPKLVREDDTVLWNPSTVVPNWLFINDDGVLNILKEGIYSIYVGVHQLSSTGSKIVLLNEKSNLPLAVSHVINDTSVTIQVMKNLSMGDRLTLRVFTDVSFLPNVIIDMVIIRFA